MTVTLSTRESYKLSADDFAALLASVKQFVVAYMGSYDSSHDYSHIVRVSRLADELTRKDDDAQIVQLAALLHDVDDHKYGGSGGVDGGVEDVLLARDCPAALARAVATVVRHVSFSHEAANPADVAAALAVYPELAVVQDADRLDALGAFGIARCFVFGAAVRRAPLRDCVAHFAEKLVRIEGRMKTTRGREMARERTRRIYEFWKWWKDENGEVTEEEEDLEQGGMAIGLE
jgi:uncharacterized protein